MRNVHRRAAAVCAARRVLATLFADAAREILEQTHGADDVIVCQQTMRAVMIVMMKRQIRRGRRDASAVPKLVMVAHGCSSRRGAHYARATAADRTCPFGGRHCANVYMMGGGLVARVLGRVTKCGEWKWSIWETPLAMNHTQRSTACRWLEDAMAIIWITICGKGRAEYRVNSLHGERLLIIMYICCGYRLKVRVKGNI